MVGLLTGTFLMYNTQSYPTQPPPKRKRWGEKKVERRLCTVIEYLHRTFGCTHPKVLQTQSMTCTQPRCSSASINPSETSLFASVWKQPKNCFLQLWNMGLLQHVHMVFPGSGYWTLDGKREDYDWFVKEEKYGLLDWVAVVECECSRPDQLECSYSCSIASLHAALPFHTCWVPPLFSQNWGLSICSSWARLDNPKKHLYKSLTWEKKKRKKQWAFVGLQTWIPPPQGWSQGLQEEVPQK
jgi:hypothetical protein